MLLPGRSQAAGREGPVWGPHVQGGLRRGGVTVGRETYVGLNKAVKAKCKSGEGGAMRAGFEKGLEKQSKPCAWVGGRPRNRPIAPCSGGSTRRRKAQGRSEEKEGKMSWFIAKRKDKWV